MDIPHQSQLIRSNDRPNQNGSERTFSVRPVVLPGFVFVLFSGLLFGQGATPPSALPAPIPTNSRSFSIPFEVRPDHSADPAKDVELLVSKDRGTRWYSGGRLPVDGKRFDFKAEADGEYWFAFRTMTLSGATKQNHNGQAQIRVLVDATAPVLTLELQQRPSGEIFVQWKAEDQYLQGKRPDFAVSASSFDGKKDWKTLNVDGRNLRGTSSEIAGQFVFWPDNGVSELEVRAIISDIAGNRAEKTSFIKLKPVQRDLESILRDSLSADTVTDSVAGSEDEQNTLPDAPVRSFVAEPMNGSNFSNPSWENSGQPARGIPITPPKPIRIPRNQRNEIARKPVAPQNEKIVLAEEYRPAPSLNFPVDETRRESFVPADPEQTVSTPTPVPQKQEAADFSSDLFANMDRFFDGQLKKELDMLEQNRKPVSRNEKPETPERLEDGPAWPALTPKLSPAAPMQAFANQRSVVPTTSSPENRTVIRNSDFKPPSSQPVPNKEEPKKEEPKKDAEKTVATVTVGRISGVSLNKTASQAQIIVKWNVGDDSWKSARIDVLRGASSNGPWEPISTHLPNTGEYWWFLTSDDLKPFHLMIRTQGPQGNLSDATQTPIQIPAELIEKKGP